MMVRSQDLLKSIDAQGRLALKLAGMRSFIGAVLELRVGERPPTLDWPIASDPVARWPLPVPSSWTDGSAEGGIDPVIIIKGQVDRVGIVEWFRIVAKDGTVLQDGTVGVAGSNADLMVNMGFGADKVLLRPSDAIEFTWRYPQGELQAVASAGSGT